MDTQRFQGGQLVSRDQAPPTRLQDTLATLIDRLDVAVAFQRGQLHRLEGAPPTVDDSDMKARAIPLGHPPILHQVERALSLADQLLKMQDAVAPLV